LVNTGAIKDLNGNYVECLFCRTGKGKIQYKENDMTQAIRDAFPGKNIIQNKTLRRKICDSKQYRPDVQLEFFNVTSTWDILVECDEHAHEKYCDAGESKRMSDLANVTGRPIWFIRFNPDTAASNYTELLNTIKFCMQNKPNVSIHSYAVKWLFYPTEIIKRRS
jgi:hypothetical protein